MPSPAPPQLPRRGARRQQAWASRAALPPLTARPGELLALPPGFSYEIVAESGVTDLDGGWGKTPDRPDGTGSFSHNNRWRLVNNHELGAAEKGTAVTLQQDHGFVFEVFPEGPDAQPPASIRAFGRFPHEGVVVRPSRDEVYLTEDASKPTGLLYRWTAPRGVRIGSGLADQLGPDAGRLEAMKVLLADGSVLPDLAYVTSAEIGREFDVAWVNVPDRHATTTSIRNQFTAGQVTYKKKLEGAWGDRKGFYFAASYALVLGVDLPVDAVQHDGQIWYYDYDAHTLTLVAYYPYVASQHPATGTTPVPVRFTDLVFDGPDNVHVTPYGSLMLAEDGVGDQHLISWTQEGGSVAFARNLIPFDGEFVEFTGPNFSPDAMVLFANVQQPGHVFALRGPWGAYLG